MIKTLAIAAVLGVVALPVAADVDCEYQEQRQAVLDVDGAKELFIDASAGFLKVIGSNNLSEVVVEGVACASRASDLADIQLETRRRGDRLVIEVDLPDFNWGWDHNVSLDLTVRVPSDLALDIEDGSGFIDLREVGTTRIRDGSGEIEVDTVFGDLTIEDGSGEIDIRNVRGKVRIDEDGSGSIQISGVEGDVEIEEDGSGSITIRDVVGSVRVNEDGSGSIRAVGITGDFTVDRDGSGGISFDSVGGRVSLPR